MEEEAFERLSTDELVELSDDPDDMERASGLWSQMVPLTEILSKVSKLNENRVAYLLSRPEIFENVRDLTSRLDQWHFCLPDYLQITPDNLKQYNEKGFGRTLVALHLGYHHHSQQLYFGYLSLVPHSSAEELLASMYARRCKEHAAKLSNLMWIANTTPGLECLWGINGHLLVVSSAIHLHTLLSSSAEDQIKAAKVMLEHNFELLIQMEGLWPSLKWSMSRLRAFHRACRASMHSSFDMTHWMLIFLQRFGLPVDEEREKGAGLHPGSFSPQADFPAFHDVGSVSGYLSGLSGIDILQEFI